MEENKQVEQQESFDVGPKAQFGEVVRIEPCTKNECSNGHKWPAQLALASCPGCGGQILMVRMINCPVCNEPTEKFTMRTDHTNQGLGIAALCRGQQGAAESNVIEMKRNAVAEVIEKWDAESGRMK
jgi:hypothetical protein